VCRLFLHVTLSMCQFRLSVFLSGSACVLLHCLSVYIILHLANAICRFVFLSICSYPCLCDDSTSCLRPSVCLIVSYIYIDTHTHINVYVFIYIYTEREREKYSKTSGKSVAKNCCDFLAGSSGGTTSTG